MSRAQTNVKIVERHLAVRAFDFANYGTARSGEWIWRVGDERHVMADAPALYRSITQAWDLPVHSARLAERGDVVLAELALGDDVSTKRVSGKYHVEEGQVAAATLHDLGVERRTGG